MKAGQESQTAILVCVARAIAHNTIEVGRYTDPTALTLLPPEGRTQVAHFKTGEIPHGLAARMKHAHLDRLTKVMVARTVAIDEAIREAAHAQLVILGAGLDGRAWRMPELRDVTVFEVDHPDSQRAKRERVASLKQTAREVRFVPVDFERDKLDDALKAAGHDPSKPTTWIWEGVVMYLTAASIEATMTVVAQRSAPGSRLTINYHSPAFVLFFIGLMLKRLGEPLRSSFTPESMNRLMHKFGFQVRRDQSAAEIGATLSPIVAQAAKAGKHLRIVTADRSR